MFYTFQHSSKVLNETYGHLQPPGEVICKHTGLFRRFHFLHTARTSIATPLTPSGASSRLPDRSKRSRQHLHDPLRPPCQPQAAGGRFTPPQHRSPPPPPHAPISHLIVEEERGRAVSGPRAQGTLLPEKLSPQGGRGARLSHGRGALSFVTQEQRSELSNIYQRIRHGHLARMAIGRFNIYFTRCVPRCQPKRFE